ncbi:hypothetical protein GGR23_003998 [Gellertiella hungarica]|uniref:Uncharacterized protein n=1 Tax=Gellertiella hungarica TaxID=1572859 RepID=A0A7W6J8K6_9HYPH|nr:hypothetical protein [Gellertiella hungarica]
MRTTLADILLRVSCWLHRRSVEAKNAALWVLGARNQSKQ